ncbi:MAG: FeoB-associated Cys-rich membrane protein [Tannerella sp.]|nr:FeoB-associated Cys-rich membrane protein [Tannerella sp.]
MAIIIIGTLVAGYAGWKIYRLFVPSKKRRSACDGCSQGCPMKDVEK